jgi:c-di-GMP phosphodiesterase
LLILKRKILVVDDSPINRTILRKILESDGYEVLEAENGQIALDILEDKSKNVSLVMLDLSMPVMSGYELLNRMNESGIINRVSVIVTTGSNLQDAEIKSLDSGATDFVVKPYNAEIVKRRVKSILRLRDNAVLMNRLEIDTVTGCNNRESFFIHAEEIIRSNPNQEYDIICTDIEDLKLINKKYGLQTGDKLLKFIPISIERFPNPDTLCLIGRIGSDSFAVLRKKVKMHSQKELTELYTEIFKDAPVKNVIVKYGVYHITDSNLDVTFMCDCAKMAISSIKRKYGVIYAVYDDSMKEKLEKDHLLVECMEHALANSEFKMYLQPKHDANTNDLAGAEALVRWIHPEFGLIPPNDFIPLFEKNGFVSKVDYYIWTEACALLAKWIDEKKKLIPISVNVSRIDFVTYNLPEVICNLVDSYKIPHELLHLEITESAYADDQKKIIDDVSNLRKLGFLIEMDDFGSGYSSLNMLAELPIDILKLNMRFLQGKTNVVNNKKMIVVNFILSLSKWLHNPTIAEGVETKEELEMLKSLGCTLIQGYYFSKPISVVDFEKYMEKYQ